MNVFSLLSASFEYLRYERTAFTIFVFFQCSDRMLTSDFYRRQIPMQQVGPRTDRAEG